MNETLMRRLFGAAVFFTTLLIYLLTVQSNVSFWDCGEFIASSFLLQVPHPPGTPFFLLVGRLFSMIPFGDNVAFSVNMISVFSSAFTALFLYLVVVKLIENYTKEEAPTLSGRFATHIAGVIGALSLAFADTFWFNAVEAEVYAFATFFIGAVTYLMMLWNEKADEIDNEKYLVMIAYLIGLSTGVHLMSTLAIVPIVMVVTFRKFISDEAILKSTSKIFAGHFAVGLLVAILLWSQETDVRPPSSDIYKAFDSRFLMFVAAVVGIYAIAVWKKIFQWNSIYLPVLIGGVALIITYPGMVKYIPKLLYAVGGNSYFLNIFVVLAILGALIYFVHWARIHNKNSQRLIAKTVLFLILGYTSYSMIMIRSNQDTPINLNSPTDMEGLVSYLSREQYGDFPTFKRRYSQEPQHQGIYENYSSDLDFFWNYQMNHMFNRYVMWNYVGRVSTVQDSGVDWSQLFGIPFLLGLFGVYYHFRRDWKMGIVFLVMFVFLGWLTAFYQNQQNPQPRERDYFYTGAFFVFSIWVGLGVKGVVELLANQLKESAVTKPAVASVLILSFAFVPGNMLLENFNRNDRSRNFVPWDYSYNMLQSVAPNAVIFTNGDNDTFPLWYLQDVEGVRQDVRIANLSLLNTPWYIKQLKNTEPHGAEKIKMTLSDAQIDRIGPQQWNTKEVSIPVTPEAFEQIGITDTALTKKTEIRWKMPHTAQFGNVTAVRTQDPVALDLTRANNWERPIYFAVTSSDQAKLGLNDYLKMEGMAF
ncbi:MAG: DUF2723 domain-containing protein, partial [Melioribacteraceae bacterium]|nr:DUF2723 domain-containing protein [Melioribacteraceae bacterium]